MSTDRRTEAALFFAPLLAGVLGSIPTARSVRTWYRALDRPSWTPPDRAFGPVWTTLYLLMGLAVVIVHRASAATPTTAARATPDTRAARPASDGTPARPALRLFAVQLALNVAWSFIFFGARAIRAAGVEIVLLWAAIAATMAAFWRVRPVAAVLLLPYLAWTSLATALNLEIWRRNA